MSLLIEVKLTKKPDPPWRLQVSLRSGRTKLAQNAKVCMQDGNSRHIADWQRKPTPSYAAGEAKCRIETNSLRTTPVCHVQELQLLVRNSHSYDRGSTSCIVTLENNTHTGRASPGVLTWPYMATHAENLPNGSPPAEYNGIIVVVFGFISCGFA